MKELLLDTENIEAVDGVAFGVNRPTKYAGNPIYPAGVNNDVPDHEKNGVVMARALPDGATGLWCFVSDATGFAPGITYQRSEDGIAFNRTAIGLVSYAGNTDNVICSPAQPVGAIYDETLGKYIGVADIYGGNVGVFIVSSDDEGETWKLERTILTQNNATQPDYTEGNTIAKRSDGKYVVYGIRGQNAQRRSVHAWLSDSTAYNGTYTYQGAKLTATTQDDQYHSIGNISTDSGIILLIVGRYNKTTELLPEHKLYVSRDGLTLALLDATWFSVGAAGAWDDSILFYLNSAVNNGNTHRFYYSGAAEIHTAYPRDARIGMLEIGLDRIGQVSGTGTVITNLLSFPVLASLLVNCNTVGGNIKIELLDAADAVVPGYDKDSFDTISGTDTYSAAATWGGVIAPSGNYKIKFYLTAATLYSFNLDAAYDLDLTMLIYSDSRRMITGIGK